MRDLFVIGYRYGGLRHSQARIIRWPINLSNSTEIGKTLNTRWNLRVCGCNAQPLWHKWIHGYRYALVQNASPTPDFRVILPRSIKPSLPVRMYEISTKCSRMDLWFMDILSRDMENIKCKLESRRRMLLQDIAIRYLGTLTRLIFNFSFQSNKSSSRELLLLYNLLWFR